MSKTLSKTALPAAKPLMQPLGPLGEYMLDAAQRTVLFWDVLRQRSDQYYAQKAKAVPHVLSFDAELVLDARSFDKPVNYLLVRDDASTRASTSSSCRFGPVAFDAHQRASFDLSKNAKQAALQAAG